MRDDKITSRYECLSRDDELQGESNSISKAILTLGSHISQADEPKHNSRILLPSTVHKPPLTNLYSLNQAIQQIASQLAKLRMLADQAHPKVYISHFRGALLLG